MFRIHRDVRFLKDKRPYEEHAACQFRRTAMAPRTSSSSHRSLLPGLQPWCPKPRVNLTRFHGV